MKIEEMDKSVPKPYKDSPTSIKGYEDIFAGMVELLETARRLAARAVNAVMTATYWEIGRRIVEWELGGKNRAPYGEELMKQLSQDLTERFGRGFSHRNIYLMRSFYSNYHEILQTVSAKSDIDQPIEIIQTVSGKRKVQTPSAQSKDLISYINSLANIFPLSWSHYVSLLSVKEPEARSFYESEALKGGWTVRQLDRQITTNFYERTLLSKNKAALLTKGRKLKHKDEIAPEQEIKDPFLLEFLGLKDEYYESDLEEALIQKLETFLLELGNDFTFVGRQKRLRIGDTWYRIDLIFFHRALRCMVIIDLKIGKFAPADVGQMTLYLNYISEHWKKDDENPPVGLILCSQKDEAVVYYSLKNLPNKILASEYKMQLPDKKLLEAELKRTRKALESHLKIKAE